jgi:hypothetical protein
VTDARTLIRILADESRLRAHAAVLLGARSTADVVQTTGLSVRETLKALTRLESVRLVTRDRDGWVAHPEVLRSAVRESVPTTEPVDYDDVVDPGEAAVLRTFLPEGVLVQIPAAQGKRRIVLDHVARIFEAGVRYPEREVNAMLRAFHSDHAALRRYLVDEGFLSREGAVYWRTGGHVVV